MTLVEPSLPSKLLTSRDPAALYVDVDKLSELERYKNAKVPSGKARRVSYGLHDVFAGYVTVAKLFDARDSSDERCLLVPLEVQRLVTWLYAVPRYTGEQTSIASFVRMRGRHGEMEFAQLLEQCEELLGRRAAKVAPAVIERNRVDLVVGVLPAVAAFVA
jgi:hypothetical protein